MSPEEWKIDNECARIAIGTPSYYPDVKRALDILSDASKREKRELVPLVEQCAKIASSSSLDVVSVSMSYAELLNNQLTNMAVTDGVWEGDDV